MERFHRWVPLRDSARKGETVVVKKLLGSSLHFIDAFAKEARFLYDLKHDNIVRIKAVCHDPVARMLEYVYFDLSVFGGEGQVSSLKYFMTCLDTQITRESGVLDLLDAGDNVMVDRGFDISNIVPDGVTVNMPPFLAGGDKLTAAETGETMSIASVRILVERAIGRMKTYHILDGTLPNTLSPHATQIVKVCGLLTKLTNFLSPSLKPANP